MSNPTIDLQKEVNSKESDMIKKLVFQRFDATIFSIENGEKQYALYLSKDNFYNRKLTKSQIDDIKVYIEAVIDTLRNL